MSDRVRRTLAAVAVAGLVAGCGGLSTNGEVHLGRSLPAVGGVDDAFDLDVKALPPSWRSGMTAAEVVAGFLHAVVNSDGDYAIARSYLTPAAARGWDPTQSLTTYDGLRLSYSPATGGAQLVHLHATRTGRVDLRGDYDPTVGTVDQTLTMVRTGGQWRIDRLAAGVLLSSLDAQRSLRPARVYYLSRNARALVPEQTFLQTTRNGFATALVRTLLAGPGAWLAPSVTRAAPAGTTLIGNVPVDPAGVADVNLSPSVRQASPDQLQALSAQIVWTLRQVTDITAVRLLADGSPLAVPGVPVRQRVTAWPEYDPGAPPAQTGAVVIQAGHVEPVLGAPRAIRRLPIAGAVAAALSTDGQTIAVVHHVSGGRLALAIGPVAGPLVDRLTSIAMTAPTVAVTGEVVTVVGRPGGQQVFAVSRSGTVRPVSMDASVLASSLTTLRLSRDGARVAVVSAGRLLVGRVETGRDGMALRAFRHVATGLTDVVSAAWTGAGDLAVTAAASHGRRIVVLTDVDGYSVRAIALDGVVGRPVGVTAAPGEPLLVSTAAGLVWSDAGGWHRLGAGTAAAYPG